MTSQASEMLVVKTLH